MANLLHSSGWETGDLSEWDGETDVSGHLDVTAVEKYQGSYGLKCGARGTNNYLIKTPAGGGFDLYHVKIRLKLPTLAVVPSGVHCKPIHATGASQGGCYIRKNAGGFWECYQEAFGGSSVGYQQMTGWVDGDWNMVECYAEDTAIGGNCFIRCNGLQVNTCVALNAAQVFTFFCGNFSVGNWGEDFWIDNWQVWDAETAADHFYVPPAASFASISTSRDVFDQEQTAASIVAQYDTAATISGLGVS